MAVFHLVNAKELIQQGDRQTEMCSLLTEVNPYIGEFFFILEQHNLNIGILELYRRQPLGYEAPALI